MQALVAICRVHHVSPYLAVFLQGFPVWVMLVQAVGEALMDMVFGSLRCFFVPILYQSGIDTSTPNQANFDTNFRAISGGSRLYLFAIDIVVS